MQGATKGWVASAATISPALSLGGITITDVFAIFDACDKDDALIFKNATQYNIENPVKCEPTDATISESGTWSLSSDKKVIRFAPTGDSPYEANILELSDATLRATFVDQFNGVTYTTTYTFKPRQ